MSEKASGVCLATNRLGAGEDEMCTTVALQHLQAGACIVDVREHDEVRALAFNVPEVLNIPMGELAHRWHSLPKDRELLVARLTGDQSRQASALLREKGLTNIKTLRSGMLLWMQKGYPVIASRFAAPD